MPTFFISHGGPDILLQPSPARDFLEGFSKTLGRPRAVVVASAHFMTRQPVVVADKKPGMIYDFGGFPDELYRIVYPAPGEESVAQRTAMLVAKAGMDPVLVPERGYDHGTWVPFKLIYPDADVPLVQLAVQPKQNPEHHYKLGVSLRELGGEDVAIVGSGSATHNLYEYFRGGYAMDAQVVPWVSEFSDWLNEKLDKRDLDALFDYRAKAPGAVENHPTDEHLMPLFVALGAAPEGAKSTRIHTSVQHGVLMMDAYAFA